MSRFNISIKMTGEVMAVEEYEKKMLNVYKKTAEKAKELIIRNIHEKKIIAFENLLESVYCEPRGKGYITGVGVPYADAIEKGSRPHWIPIAPLKAWAKKKGRDESDAYGIRWDKHLHGTPARPFFRPAIAAARYIWMDRYIQEEFGTGFVARIISHRKKIVYKDKNLEVKKELDVV